MNYDITQVYNALKTNVGFKQPTDTANYIALDSTLLTSDSGLYANSVHPLLSAETIQQNAPNFLDFASGTTTASLSAWYEDKRKDAILQAVTSVFNVRKDKAFTSDLKLSQNLLVDSNNFDTKSKVSTANDKIGIVLTPYISRNFKLKINRIALNLTGLSGPEDISLYFETSTGNVIDKVDGLTVDNGFNWIDVNKELYLSDGEKYNSIFCYIKLSELSKTPNQISYIFENTKYLNSIPYSDTTQLGYYPFDLDLSIGCDFTNMIVNNKSNFSEVIQLQLGVNLLEIMLNSMRINSTQSRAEELAKYDLDGADNPNSLRTKLNKSIKNTALDFSTLDKFCLPCAKRKLTIKTV